MPWYNQNSDLPIPVHISEPNQYGAVKVTSDFMLGMCSISVSHLDRHVTEDYRAALRKTADRLNAEIGRLAERVHFIESVINSDAENPEEIITEKLGSPKNWKASIKGELRNLDAALMIMAILNRQDEE